MKNAHVRGIALMLLAMAALTIMDALMKDLAGRYPALQVTALRGMVSLPFIAGWVLLREKTFRTLLEVRWGWQVARGLLGVAMLTTFIYAISDMPLSQAYALFFVAPLLITALSVPLLGESVGPSRWAAVLVGFGGMLIIVRPGAATLNLATLAVLLTAVCYSLNAISVRILGRTDSAVGMSFWFIAVVAVVAGLLALPDWHAVRMADAVPLLALGISGALGQVWITASFRCAPVSVVAPFEYSSLLWGVALDLAIWGELPPPIVFYGAAVIVGSGLYLMHRAQQKSEGEKQQ